MTIDEAIKILTEFKDPWTDADIQDYIKAKNLGIEALKLARSLASIPGRHESFRLPGETEIDESKLPKPSEIRGLWKMTETGK